MDKMTFKCKPVYNFQSIEFEMTIDAENAEELKLMFEVYKAMLQGLQSIAPEQPALAKAVSKPSEPMATPKQVNCLVNLGMAKEDALRLTQKQASQSIDALLKK